LGTGSTGGLRVALNINGQNYNLNGTDTYLVSANANENADSNMLNGNLIVNGIAGQYIRMTVREGTLRYVAKYSYFHGFYLVAS
jgi:formylmethanofuran dehydrogenase subunit C